MIVWRGRSRSRGGSCSLLLCVLAALGANCSHLLLRNSSRHHLPRMRRFLRKRRRRGSEFPTASRSRQFAAEPDVVQPIAMTIDHKGRLWVVENYAYPVWLGGPTGRDRILIFEDADGDGRFDRRTDLLR